MCAIPRRNSGCIGLAFLFSYTLRSLALRAVVADTKELRIVPHDTALPVLFVREQTRMEGFESAVGHEFFSSNVLVIFLSLLCFKAHQPTTSGGATLCPGHLKNTHDFGFSVVYWIY